MGHYFFDIQYVQDLRYHYKRALRCIVSCAVLSNILMDWEEDDDHDSTQPTEDPYRPEAGIDDTGIQPFVICDFILYLHSKIWSLESTICPRSLDSMFFIGCYQVIIRIITNYFKGVMWICGLFTDISCQGLIKQDPLLAFIFILYIYISLDAGDDRAQTRAQGQYARDQLRANMPPPSRRETRLLNYV